jgi:hypothetical protein
MLKKTEFNQEKILDQNTIFKFPGTKRRIQYKNKSFILTDKGLSITDLDCLLNYEDYFIKYEVLPLVKHVNKKSFVTYNCEQNILILDNLVIEDKLKNVAIYNINSMSLEEKMNYCYCFIKNGQKTIVKDIFSSFNNRLKKVIKEIIDNTNISDIENSFIIVNNIDSFERKIITIANIILNNINKKIDVTGGLKAPIKMEKSFNNKDFIYDVCSKNYKTKSEFILFLLILMMLCGNNFKFVESLDEKDKIKLDKINDVLYTVIF